MKKIELSEHFTMRKMLLYSLPGIFETFAITSFQMVDGYFVSNMLGIAPFAAVVLISPVFFLLYAVGFMFGEGASAMISQLMGAVLGLLFVACAKPIAAFYVGYDEKTFSLTVQVIRTMTLQFGVYGFNLFVSSFFTGLGNGRVSAIIALCSSLFAPMLTLITLPTLFGGEAIWYTMPMAALLTTALCVILLHRVRHGRISGKI